jgi:hypothetical protein
MTSAGTSKDPLKGKRGGEKASEWPARQRLMTPLPPVLTRETILATFDADRDTFLSAKELRARQDLLAQWDLDGDGRVASLELQSDLDQIAGGGVEATLDGFLERWDLNRDGVVSRAELPLWSRK